MEEVVNDHTDGPHIGREIMPKTAAANVATGESQLANGPPPMTDVQLSSTESFVDPSTLHDLSGRVVLVTGAASGIGRSVAFMAASHGAFVVAADLDAEGAERTSADLNSAGHDSAFRKCDVTLRGDFEAAVAEALRHGDRLDGLCNVAGIAPPGRDSYNFDPEEFDRILAANTRSVGLGMQMGGRVMKEQRRGSIVNVTSATVDLTTPGRGMYAASKAAASQLTRTASREFGRDNIRVNAVAPGWIETPLTASSYRLPDGQIDEAARARYLDSKASRAALNRLGQTMEIASAVIFLLSDASSFITGQTIRVNGGDTMV